jgi:predicted SAM-dependent methyltransferase
MKLLSGRLTTRQEVSKILKKHPDILKLNLGCGTDYKEGWVNIDNNSDHNITKLDLNIDLRRPLPFKDNSVDYIFHEHFMEHLTIEQSRTALKDYMRVLKKGGVMRIAMPDLETIVKEYYDKHWKRRPFIKRFGLEFVETRAEMLNMHFRWWGHMWLYDWEELQRRFKEVELKSYHRCELRKSKHKALRNLEIRDESYLIAEITK